MANSLDSLIAAISKVPGLADLAAGAVADIVENELTRTIKAGTDPYGRPLEPRKADGGQPLRNADKAMTVRASGDTIYITLRGVEARHHLGQAKGGIERHLIPTEDRLPPSMERQIETEIAKAFEGLFT